MPHMALPKLATEAHERVLDGRPSESESAHSSVDRQASTSLSFATHRAAQPPFGGRIPVSVGPGRPSPGSSANRESGERVSQVPLQAAKVQRPALRVETLPRDRLLDWLRA